MNQFLAYWKKTRFIDRLSQIKQVYIEQRDAVGFSAVLTNYTTFMDNFCTPLPSFSRPDKCKERGIQPSSVTGALFFGVCRGKISEGIDFKDYMARAVISLSIPYPNSQAHEIRLMREYMDQQHQLNPNVQDGSAWYDEQAFRALNQGLGRCIRHSRDYGAIILLESRFGNPEVKKRLSRWFRDEIRVNRSDAELIRGLKAFFASCEKAFAAGNGENVLESTQPSTQRGVSLTQESAWRRGMREEEEEEEELAGKSTQSAELIGVSSMALDKNARSQSAGSLSMRISSQTTTETKAIDVPSKQALSLKRDTSTTQLSTQLSTQSVKRLHTESIFCPVCARKLADSPWEEIETSLQYAKELLRMARMAMQMHGYTVETGEELGSIKAKLLDTDLLIQGHFYTAFAGAREEDRGGERDAQAFYYHPKDKILLSWRKRVMIRYDVVYCSFDSKVVKNGKDPYRVLVPIGMICKKSELSSLVGKFILLPVPCLSSSV